MKFICDNCKAKYQIGDEKVAGKMVRMKCRRCGHLVQVSASVTESSVAQALPTEPPRITGEEANHRPSLSDDDPTAIFAAGSGEGSLASLVEAMTKAPDLTPAAIAGAHPQSAGHPQSSPSGSAPRPVGAPRPPAAPRAPVAGRPAGGSNPGGGLPESADGGSPQSKPAGRPAPAAPVAKIPESGRSGPVARAPEPPRAAPVVKAPEPVRAAPVARAPEPPRAAPVVKAPEPARATPVARAPEPARATPVARAPDAAPPAAAVAAFKPAAPQERATPKAPATRITPSEDWYVGVSGVPLGPVRLSVIRDKALAGAVDGESLVWREGFEEWQPLKGFPELLEIVTQAQATRLASSGRRTGASVAGGPTGAPATLAPAGRTMTPAGVIAPPAAPPIAATQRPPLREPDPPRAEAAEPAFLAAAGGAARGGAGAPLPVDMLADPFAARPAGAVPPEAAGAGLFMPNGASGSAQAHRHSPLPATVPAASSGDSAALLATRESHADTGLSRRRSGMSPMAYAFIAMAAAFGGVSAFVLLTSKSAPVPVAPSLQVQAPLTAGVALPPPPPSTAEPDPAAPVDSTSPKAELAPSSKSGNAASQKAQTDAKPSATASTAAIDMSGFSGSGVSGPRSGPGGAGESSAMGQLSQREISNVVDQSRPNVRRRCWQPSLEARASNAPATARVSASVVIGPSGAVQSVTATGAEKDYPGLSTCITGLLRNWKFPPSSGTTPVSIPFVFAAQ